MVKAVIIIAVLGSLATAVYTTVFMIGWQAPVCYTVLSLVLLIMLIVYDDAN